MSPTGIPRGRRKPLGWLLTPGRTRPSSVLACAFNGLCSLYNLAADNNLTASITVPLAVIALRRRHRRAAAR